MKKIIYNLSLILFLLPISNLFAVTIWSENFESYADNSTTASNNNTINGANDWSLSNTGVSGHFKVEQNNAITGNRSFEGLRVNASSTNGSIWTSESINISGYTNVALSMNWKEIGGLEDSQDWLDIEYNLDGSGWINVGNGQQSGNANSGVASTTGLNGSTLQIRVRMYTSWNSEYWVFDDVLVTGTSSATSCNPCYSVANGNINNTSTWSNASGGTAGYSPITDGTGSLIIEGGNTVNMNTDFSLTNLTVGATGNGILIWTANDIELNGMNGGTIMIASGSKIDEGNRTNAAIYIQSDVNLIVNDLTNGLEIDDFFIDGNNDFTISGSGKILVNNDITFNGDDATIANNLTGSFSVTDDFLFPNNNDRNQFTNNGIINITSEVFFGSSSNDGRLINNGTMTIGANLNFQDVGFNATQNYVENNGNMTITSDLIYGNDQCEFVNNGTFSVNNQIFFGGNSDNCSFSTNSSSTTTINKFYFSVETGPGNTFHNITNEGMFNVINDILCELNGVTFTNQNTGTMTISGNIIQGYNGQNITNLDIINSGIMTVSNFELIDNGEEMDVINSGTLNFVDVNASNGDLDITNTGTINQTGTFTNNEIDNSSQFTNSTNGRWNYAGNNHDTDTRLFCSATGNTFNYNGAGNQSMIDVQNNDYHHLEITISGTKSSANHMDIEGNLTINESASLNVNNGNDDITIAGNWINTSSDGFTEGTRSVTFDGTANQTITCSTIGEETFYNLSINKSNGSQVILNNEVALIANNSSLDFSGTNGYITLNGNDFTIAHWKDGKITGYDENEFFIVDQTAFIKYEGINNGEILNIPMGLGTGSSKYALANITLTNAGSGTFDANLCGQIQLDGGICTGTSTTTRAVNYTWNFISTSNNAIVTLYWDTSTELTSFNRLLSKVIHHDGTEWEDLSVGGAATWVVGTIFCRSGVTTGFSPFGIQDEINILPIKLLSFTGKLTNGTTLLDWVTSTEINNDFFTIQKSQDGKTFEDIQVIKGQGNSHIDVMYTTTDDNPYEGVSYYRLKQTDFDGKYTFSSIIQISNDTKLAIGLYPNPLQGNTLYLTSNISSEETIIIIHNAIGQEVYSKNVKIENNTSITLPDLIEGTYIIRVFTKNDVFQEKLIIEK